MKVATESHISESQVLTMAGVTTAMPAKISQFLEFYRLFKRLLLTAHISVQCSSPCNNEICSCWHLWSSHPGCLVTLYLVIHDKQDARPRSSWNTRFAWCERSPLPRWLNMKLSQRSVALSKFSKLYLLFFFFFVQTWEKMPGRMFKLSHMTQFTYHSRQFTNLSRPMPKAVTLQGVCSRIWRWCCCQFCFHFMFELNEPLFLGLATYLQFTQLPCEPVYLIILYDYVAIWQNCNLLM